MTHQCVDVKGAVCMLMLFVMACDFMLAELDLRVVEECKSKLRGYGSRVLAPMGKDLIMYNRLIVMYDGYRKVLCTKKRAVMAEFQAQLQRASEDFP